MTSMSPRPSIASARRPPRSWARAPSHWIHQIEPSTTLRVEAFSGCACAEEEPYSSGLRVKLATPTSTNQDYIELTAPGPFHIWTEGVVQSSLELIFTIIRTGSPYVRRLEVSACACVHIP